MIHCEVILLVKLFYPQGKYIFLKEIAQIYLFLLRIPWFRLILYEKEIGWIIYFEDFKDTLSSSWLWFIRIMIFPEVIFKHH